MPSALSPARPPPKPPPGATGKAPPPPPAGRTGAGAGAGAAAKTKKGNAKQAASAAASAAASKPPGAPTGRTTVPLVWTEAEDQQLRSLVGEYGTKKWAAIAETMGTKASKQCRRRWQNYLNAEVTKGEWSAHEDALLIEGHKKFGNRWTEIAKMVRGRTDNAVKNRYMAICKKRMRPPTAGTLDDMTNKMMKDDVVEMQGNDRVSDTHHQPPPEKRMRTNASNKVDDVSPLAATEMQPRARPRKSPLPSRVPAAAAVVQQTAQPSSPAIIAAPIEKYVSSSVNVSHDEHAHSSPWLPSTLPPPPPPLATMDGVRRRMGFVVGWGSSPYKGVCQRPTGKWGAQIKDPVAAKTLWLGTFDTAGEAARAYDCAARRIRKDNPRTNFDMPPGGDEPIPVSVLVALATVRPELRDAAEAAVQASKSPLPSRVPAAAAVLLCAAAVWAQPIAAPTAASSSRYQGVYWDETNRVFRAQIRHNMKNISVGSSADAKEVAFMRDRAWRDLGKDPSKLNFDDTVTIPDEYLASVAKARKKFESLAAAVPPPPPPLEQVAQPSSPAIIAAPIAASGGASAYRGVFWSKNNEGFEAQIKYKGKTLYVGASADAKEAAFMRDRACRDLGKNPKFLNFDDTVPIPNEYLASVAKARKKFESLAAAVPPPPPPPPPLEQIAQPSSQDAVQGLQALAMAAASA
ncbi:MYB transcription factor [Pseudoscourfieldia marina]